MAQNKAPARRRRKLSSPDPIDVYVGSRVRVARKLAGLHQEELARRIGVSSQGLQKYESGENRVSASRLFAIATAVRQPLTFFFENDRPTRPGAAPPSLQHDEVALIRAVRGINNKDARESVLQLVKKMAAAEQQRQRRPLRP